MPPRNPRQQWVGVASSSFITHHRRSPPDITLDHSHSCTAGKPFYTSFSPRPPPVLSSPPPPQRPPRRLVLRRLAQLQRRVREVKLVRAHLTKLARGSATDLEACRRVGLGDVIDTKVCTLCTLLTLCTLRTLRILRLRPFFLHAIRVLVYISIFCANHTHSLEGLRSVLHHHVTGKSSCRSRPRLREGTSHWRHAGRDLSQDFSVKRIEFCGGPLRACIGTAVRI